jgi:hypothetical protein
MLRSFLAFYQKIFIPSLIVAITIGLIGIIFGNLPFLSTVGLGLCLISPLFQYFIYELRNEKEYYFFFNLGFSRTKLWALNIIVSIVIGKVISSI